MAEQDTMTTIYEGLSIKPSPGDSASDLVSAIIIHGGKNDSQAIRGGPCL